MVGGFVVGGGGGGGIDKGDEEDEEDEEDDEGDEEAIVLRFAITRTTCGPAIVFGGVTDAFGASSLFRIILRDP